MIIRPVLQSVVRPILKDIFDATRNSGGGSSGYTAFVLDGVIQSPVTLTRASSATYFDSAGLLQTAGTNVARVDYDNLTLVKKGLYIEGAMTNVCLRSDDLSDAAWVKTNCTAAKNAIGLSGGANTCSTVTATGASATILQSFVHGSGTRCGSMYIKRKTGTGTVEMTVDNGTTWTVVSLDGTWKRFFVAQGTLTNGVFGLRITTSGDEVLVDGCQYENPLGSSDWLPSSYIPTAGSSVSRSADILIDAAFAFGTEGTFFFEGDIYLGTGAGATLFYPSDNTTANRIVVARTNTKTIECDTYSGGVRQAIPTTTAISDGVKFKLAYGWKVNDFAVSLNGAAVVTDVLGSVPVAMSEIAIGNILIGGTQLQGHVLNHGTYNTKKTNAEIVTLAT